MSAFAISETVVWITVGLLVAAIPITLLYFRFLQQSNIESFISKLEESTSGSKSVALPHVDLNFNNNWASKDDNEASDYIVDVDSEKKLAKIILRTIALNGEKGMLIKQISDILELNEIEISHSLIYLNKKKFIESVNSQKGTIYYLSLLGTAYCNKKGYLAKVA